MTALEAVLGSGTSAAPSFHDFMEDKHLRYVTDDGELENVIRELETKLESQTKSDPLLLSVDVETAAVQSLLDEYDRRFNEHDKVQKTFAAFPHAAKCSPEQRISRDAAKSDLAQARSNLNEVARHVKRAGLNVYTGQVRLLQLYDGGDEVIVIDRWHVGAGKFDELGQRVLNKNTVIWLAHNAQFDVKMLSTLGITPARHPHCSLLQAHALESVGFVSKALAARCKLILGKELNKQQQASDWSRDPLDQNQIHYAAGDVVATWMLYQKQKHLVSTIKRLPSEDCEWTYDLMRSAIRATNEVMITGVEFDAKQHKVLSDKLLSEFNTGLSDATKAFASHSAAGAPEVDNPGSTKQVAAWLRFHLEKFPPFNTDGWPKTDTGQLQVGKEHLLENVGLVPEDHRPPLIALANWANAKKNNSTLGSDFTRFVNPITKRLHANFRIGGTETGRFSVTEPALQTINKTNEFRHLFVSKPNHQLVVCDYGQIEIRVAASVAQDRVLLKAIEDGLDVHTMVARHCFKGEYPEGVDDDYFTKGDGQPYRDAAKACIFGLVYGQGPRGLAQKLTAQGQQTSPNEASRIQHEMLELYPDLKKWIRQTHKSSDDTGFLWTPQGRVYAPHYPSQLFTKSVNTVCQGGAAEIMLLCLSKFPNVWGDLKAKLIHVVHDEIIAEVPNAEVKKAEKIMVDAMTWAATEFFPNIPQRELVTHHTGLTWASAK
ncbi:MAG: putative DNA polymerase [Prokaryotic dsDNA virus sp.]|nr:MAG: putative DNA polymerase [Prokaryotic dsDNA virus sp.]|tara:strand:+ start:14324 stop:16468 length:2145 start_codon:yes stop_codon:yes gene_type:complete